METCLNLKDIQYRLWPYYNNVLFRGGLVYGVWCLAANVKYSMSIEYETNCILLWSWIFWCMRFDGISRGTVRGLRWVEKDWKNISTLKENAKATTQMQKPQVKCQSHNRITEVIVNRCGRWNQFYDSWSFFPFTGSACILKRHSALCVARTSNSRMMPKSQLFSCPHSILWVYRYNTILQAIISCTFHCLHQSTLASIMSWLFHFV